MPYVKGEGTHSPSPPAPAPLWCRYVIHMAAPFFLNGPESQAFTRVVNPTVRGVVNVLGAVSRAGSVERVVMTSSIVACMWGIHHADEFEV